MGQFNKSLKSLFYFFFLWLTASVNSYGQADNKVVFQQFDKYRTRSLQEKLFMHLDRSFYLTGETMWFKLYYVDGTFHKPLGLSKVAYVEVLDKDRKPVLQAKISLEAGNLNGSFYLPASLSSGHYVVRAYTNWMKNFSPDFYFEQSITLVNPFKRLGLPIQSEAVEYKIQFFPEGGNLVRDVPSKVAFKGTNSQGKGVDFQGFLLNQNNDTIARFKPLKFGIGTFTFIPQSGEEYRAQIKLVSGEIVPAKLPVVYEQGFGMRLEEIAPELIQVTISTPPQTTQFVPALYLFVHTRQEVKVAQVKAVQGNKTTFQVEKQLMGEGISHFTVFNDRKQPLCERLYFKQPQPGLQIQVKSAQQQYGPRQKISLDLFTHNQANQPLRTDLSIAIYLADSLNASPSNSIATYLYLTSDLRGPIESPEYYVQTENQEVKDAVDNLMLTHGWRRFRWEDVLQKDTAYFEYVPEYSGHLIRGRTVHTTTGQPVAGIVTYLAAPSSHIRLYPSGSSESGEIQFEMQDFFGPREIVLQTDTRRDSLYRFEIFNPYSDSVSTFRLPQFDISENLKNTILSRSVAMQTQNVYLGEKNNRFRFPKIDSLPFYGKADEKYLLDNFIRFTVMEDVLREYATGVQARRRKGNYYFNVFDYPNKRLFEGSPLVLLDGVPVFDLNKIMAFDPLKIKKLEVMTRRYYLGPLSFSGIVSYTTHKGNLGDFQLDPRFLILEYDGLQLQRKFYVPAYDSEKRLVSRVPDLRNLLYWSPALQTDAQGRQKLDFYTSDQEGVYVVEINGLSPNGQAGSQRFTFEVKNAASP